MLMPLFARGAAPLRPPSPCEVCRGWSTAALCAACLARFAAPRPRCSRCGLGLGVAAPACGACLHQPPPFAHTVCVADYGFPWDRLVADFKFHGRAELAGVLAQAMASTVRTDGTELPDWVLPVPMSGRRLAERGYNQAWELARRLAAALALPASASLLLRPVDAAHQIELGRAERLRNLRNAFMVDPARRATLRGRRVALVDDVMTTGATAHAAAEALLRAGAAAVDVWVLARTPEHAGRP
jgi:ComF family protein